VLQIGLNQPEVRSIGIELSTTRHEQATWALETIQERYGLETKNVSLSLGDITSCSFEGGTHFMLCSTAFSASGKTMSNADPIHFNPHAI
jgi:peptidyl-tRNA hydrolase